VLAAAAGAWCPEKTMMLNFRVVIDKQKKGVGMKFYPGTLTNQL